MSQHDYLVESLEAIDTRAGRTEMKRCNFLQPISHMEP